MQVFGQEWFEHHQTKLLIFLNHPLTRKWFRRVIGIKTKKPIIEITPVRYVEFLRFENELLAFNMVCYSNNVFAKSLRNSLFTYPIWNIFHFWDWLIADRYSLPSLSFGFSTFTFSPDIGSGLTTADGAVYRFTTSESLATIRSSSGTIVNAPNESSYSMSLAASTTLNEFALLRRVIMTFDTRLGPGTISSVSMNLYKTGSSALPSSEIVGVTPASFNVFVTTDYSTFGATSYATMPYASLTNSTYNSVSLSVAANSYINLSAISAFGAVLSDDFNGTFTQSWLSQGNYSVSLASSDSSNPPQLVIQGTATATNKLFGGYGFVRGFYSGR